MALLDIRNLTVKIKTSEGILTIVDKVSLTINPGKILALAGASGSGKSLVMQAIMMLRRDNVIYSADRFKLDDKDLLKLSSHQRRKIIGENISFIMQEPKRSLDPSLKIKTQIYEVMPKIKWYRFFTRIKNLIKNTKRQTAIALLHRSGIKDHSRILNSYPSQLSDVECQKVMIAMAVASEPKILLLDEPIVNLEIASRFQVLKLLDKYSKNDETSIIIISNDIASIYNFADEFAFMYAGQIVERGTREQIFKNPRHPYTASLIRSMMEMNNPDNAKKFIPVLTGKHPDYKHMPIGCRFGARCRYAKRRCNNMPEITMGKNSQYRCHFPLPDGALYSDD
jgi:cationic peptide transport system ATP-binding protein